MIKTPTLPESERGRLSRFLEQHEPRPLTRAEEKAVGWHLTSDLDEAGLIEQYIRRGVTHAGLFSCLLKKLPLAYERLVSAKNLLFFGPGFGPEIAVTSEFVVHQVLHQIAIEINPHARRALKFERPGLDVVRDLTDVETLAGPVFMTAVHALRQPTICDRRDANFNDERMQNLAQQLLRIAPDGLTIAATLPACYDVPSKFGIRKFEESFCIDADALLWSHLRDLGGRATIQTERPDHHSARLTVIQVEAQK